MVIMRGQGCPKCHVLKSHPNEPSACSTTLNVGVDPSTYMKIKEFPNQGDLP